MEILAQRGIGGGKDRVAAARGPHVVGENLALPFGVEQIEPAFGLFARLDQIVVGEKRVGADERADLVRLRGLAVDEVLRRGDGAERLRIAGLCEAVDRRLAMLHDVAEEATGGLFGPHAFVEFAGAHIEQVDGDAEGLLEAILHRRVHLRRDIGCVEDELAFLLRGLDERLVDVARHGGQREPHRQCRDQPAR